MILGTAGAGGPRPFDGEILAKLRRASVQTKYPKRAVIFVPDPNPRSLYLLDQGQARIFRVSPNGGESTLLYVPRGEVFGEAAAFDEPRESFADALVPSTVWTIDVKVFRDVVLSQAEASLEFSRQIQARLARVKSRVEDLVFRDARARIAHGLLELARDFGRPRADSVAIDLVLTQSELGTLVGASRQAVNGHLCAFQEEGLIRVENRRILILNFAALDDIAQMKDRE